MKTETYWLKCSGESYYRKVTKEEWIKAERQAGFRPKCAYTDPDYMKICATGGFGGNGVEGKITFEE